VGAALMALLSSCTSTDIESKLRFGWHTGVTKQAERMRVLWTWSSVAALIVGVMVWTLIFVVLIRDRKKNDEIPKQVKFNLPLEIVYTIIPFLVVVGLFYYTVVTENYVDKLSKNPVVNVQVDAFKWNWQFGYTHYNGTGGQPGMATDFTGTTQPISTVGSSAEIAVLVIPVNATVQFDEHSEDVVHSFWVPQFLFKRDVIPYGTSSTSRDNRFEITATTTGSFVGRCAELCGTYHSQMNFEVRVVEPAVFNAYLTALDKYGRDDPARQSKALVDANVPGGMCATTTHPFATDRNARSGDAQPTPGVCT
jgi:cytochrome c oxidase subunit II